MTPLGEQRGALLCRRDSIRRGSCARRLKWTDSADVALPLREVRSQIGSIEL
jgi:hypothetical protein